VEKEYAVLGDDGNIEFMPITKYAATVCRVIDSSQLEEREKSPTKYEPVINRDTIRHHFRELITSVVALGERERKDVHEDVGRIQEIQNDVLRWFDGDSPLAKLETYFEVFTVRKSAQRSIRSLATAYMRFTNWMPQFTEEEAVRFLRTRQANSNSRKTYSLFLRTFFKAQGIPRDRLPFEYTRIKVADEDKPKRKTMKYDRVVDFIQKIKSSGNARAGFYGSLITIYGFRPIELGRITMENIDTERHIISVQTAKHGRLRVHHIPEPIRPYVYGYEPEPVSDKQMFRIWKYICRDIGFRPPKGYGWYGVRHALFTNLVNKSRLPAMVLDKWGGWQTGQVSGAGMVGIYHAPDAGAMEELDREVLNNHPFLGFWGW
jgi:integrase